MAQLKLSNNATTTTSARISATDTTLFVTSGTGALFPEIAGDQYFKVTLIDINGNFEIVRVVARVGDTLTLVRAQNNTAAIPFPANSRVELRLLADTLDEFFAQLDFLRL